MTGLTLFRCGFVEQNGLASYNSCQFVATSAAHVLVHAAQRELGTGLVIELRRPPLVGIVAINASGDIALGKLFAVSVLMAVFALLGSRFEIHVDQFGFQVRRLVAVHTCGGAVRPEERERGLGMIEAR